ncbi:3'-5' exonuclease [Pseudomonas sp. LRF_L74]|uniref:3'-5' exonuclease n=1 Tax=Pseudomonas sp. LRF_L74 TaxID=3369422 RepID=UPI003F63B768
MINATHFVVDLETLSTDPRAAIASIGIVCVRDLAIADELYIRVDPKSSALLGGQIDASTVQWWLKQSAEARAEIDGSQPSAGIHWARDAVVEFMRRCSDNLDRALVWGNGSSFDNVILREAFKAVDDDAPWKFWNDRDLRTISALYPEAKRSIVFEGIQHHALDDARHEARILIAALQQHAHRPADQAGEQP